MYVKLIEGEPYGDPEAVEVEIYEGTEQAPGNPIFVVAVAVGEIDADNSEAITYRVVAGLGSHPQKPLYDGLVERQALLPMP